MSDDSFMTLTLAEAELGRGRVHPNPMVGAVLVGDGRVIGRGHHTKFGAPHAEIEALRDAERRGASPRGATLYVTLEPCCHHGKTPPCTDAIIAAGVAQVVYAMDDPNPLVAGKGAAALRKAGIEVVAGVGEPDARRLNEAFIRFHATGLPFVTWKLAQTLDGAIAFEPGRRAKISSAESDRAVDRMRADSDAVLVGVETVLADDPGLRVRDASGRDPWRIVFDTHLRIPADSRLVRENADRRTLVVAGTSAPERTLDAEIVRVPERNGRLDPREALRTLAQRGLLAVLLESGRTLGNALMEERLVQRTVAFIAPMMKDGSMARPGTFTRHDASGADVMLVMDVAA